MWVTGEIETKQNLGLALPEKADNTLRLSAQLLMDLTDLKHIVGDEYEHLMNTPVPARPENAITRITKLEKMKADCKAGIDLTLSKLINSEYVQNYKYGELDGAMVKYTGDLMNPADSDAKHVHGLTFLLTVWKPEQAVAEEVARFAVESLLNKGRYDVLSHPEFKEKLIEYAAMYQHDAYKVLKASYADFVTELSGQMGTDPRGLKEMKESGLHSVSLDFTAVFDLFSKMAEFKKVSREDGIAGWQKSQTKLGEIMDTPLLNQKYGILRNLPITNRFSRTNLQHARILTMLLPGLTYDMAYRILQNLKSAPNTSRSEMADIYARLSYMPGKIVYKSEDEERLFAKQIKDALYHGWPEPEGSNRPNFVGIHQERGWDQPKWVDPTKSKSEVVWMKTLL